MKEIYTPQFSKIAKTKYLCICAHQDDGEFMAYDGILKAYKNPDISFTLVVVSDGAGSARSGIYANFTDDDMKKIRRIEQKKASELGNYEKLYLLDYPSKDIKNPQNTEICKDLEKIIDEVKPSVVYTHNICDKHETHIGVAIKALNALKKSKHKPEKVYGCEVWRDLDWLNDCDKVIFDVSGNDTLANGLSSVFDSQIAGGKRYDLAIAGRRLANATLGNSHAVDTSNAVSYALDLTPVITNNLDIKDFALKQIENFKENVKNTLEKLL